METGLYVEPPKQVTPAPIRLEIPHFRETTCPYGTGNDPEISKPFHSPPLLTQSRIQFNITHRTLVFSQMVHSLHVNYTLCF